MTILPIAIRNATNDDYPYILKTWSVEFHKQYPTTHISNAIYFPHQANIINNIIKKCQVSIVCIDDEPNIICGFITYELFNKNLIIHYAQTKGIFRRMGIFTSMLKSIDIKYDNIIYTHDFKLLKEFKDKYNLIYDPTLLEKYL